MTLRQMDKKSPALFPHAHVQRRARRWLSGPAVCRCIFHHPWSCSSWSAGGASARPWKTRTCRQTSAPAGARIGITRLTILFRLKCLYVKTYTMWLNLKRIWLQPNGYHTDTARTDWIFMFKHPVNDSSYIGATDCKSITFCSLFSPLWR